MPPLGAKERAKLPDSAFAYIDSTGRRRLPINDASHVRNALARFGQVHFEDEAARDRARTRLLRAAARHGIVPIGFISAQLEPQRKFPKGTVTFLLTDVERSTELLAGLGDGYATLLAAKCLPARPCSALGCDLSCWNFLLRQLEIVNGQVLSHVFRIAASGKGHGIMLERPSQSDLRGCFPIF